MLGFPRTKKISVQQCCVLSAERTQRGDEILFCNGHISISSEQEQ